MYFANKHLVRCSYYGFNASSPVQCCA